jgi:hypothetical protein
LVPVVLELQRVAALRRFLVSLLPLVVVVEGTTEVVVVALVALVVVVQVSTVEVVPVLLDKVIMVVALVWQIGLQLALVVALVLLHRTLQEVQDDPVVLVGNFLLGRQQQVPVSQGTMLEVVRVNLSLVVSEEAETVAVVVVDKTVKLIPVVALEVITDLTKGLHQVVLVLLYLGMWGNHGTFCKSTRW